MHCAVVLGIVFHFGRLLLGVCSGCVQRSPERYTLSAKILLRLRSSHMAWGIVVESMLSEMISDAMDLSQDGEGFRT